MPGGGGVHHLTKASNLTFIFLKQVYFVIYGLKIIDHGNPDSNFESHLSIFSPQQEYAIMPKPKAAP
jgi:hypothetical protein